MRGTIAAIIKNLSPGGGSGGGGGIEKQALRLAKKAKRAILSQYDRTAKNSRKSEYRTLKYGPVGTLRRAIEKQSPVVEWIGGNLRIQVLNTSLLPFYWRTQEFGFKAAKWTWRQRFFIVARRAKDKPSKRGDLFVLKSIRQRPEKGKHIYITVKHKNGMIARHFIRAGRLVLSKGRVSFLRPNTGNVPVDR